MAELTKADIKRDVADGKRCAHCEVPWHGRSKPVETPRGLMHTSCAYLFLGVWRNQGGRYVQRVPRA